ncbi:MAG: hypothetical protein HQ483_05810 [Rhodospirillales bacterium]|nr:hypothetical protein [Rhodospirillales bacterium]
MRWLKSLVIVLGLLIVLGVVLLGFGFYKKTSDPGWALFGGKTPPAAENQPQAAGDRFRGTPFDPFGTLSLDLPAGCIIARVIPQRRYVYLEIGPTPACNRVIVVDLRKGVMLGTLKPQP